MEQDSDYVGRKFGFSRVLWEIKNYCNTPNRLDWTFHSPEFYIKGFRLTKWRMFLTRSPVSEGKYAVSFNLQRLECKPHFEDAHVDCVLEYSDHFGQSVKEDFQFYFQVNKIFKKELRHAGIAPVSAIHSDVFELKCEILVHFSDITETIPSYENRGIKRLSEDLHNLYESGVCHDLKLQLLNHNIYAHKAVLFYRITDKELKNQIAKDGLVIINAYDFNHEAVDQVIRFLYTGNIQYAITLPFISVFKFAELLDVKPIIAYYDPDEIKITTTIEVEEYCATWTIENFCNRSDNFLKSPLMSNKMMDTKWRLKVYPRGFGRKAKYVGVFFDIETKTPNEICVEFFLKNGLERRICYTNHRRIISKEIIGNRNFLELDNVKNYIRNDSLTIGLRLKISTGKEKISVGESVTSYGDFFGQTNYDLLSKDVLCLYQDKRFYDMRIELKGSNTTFYAHECILSERCPFLYHALKAKDLTYFYDINCSIIKEILFYIYSGNLNEYISLEDLFCLYQTANHFNIATLKYIVIERLKVSLSEANVKDIYEFADSENINCLRKFVQNFVEELI